jgi:hypothetical protein
VIAGNWLYHLFGLSGSGPWYGFWSGIGSDLGELAIVGGIWRLVNCHESGCLRLGHHYRSHIVCRRHRGDLT